MNVLIGNKYSDVLAMLDIDVIKSITGEYDAEEIASMFKNFYCNRIIIDLTAIKNYTDISNIQKLCINLDTSKLIFLLPPTEETASSAFVSKLISMGLYNFTTDADGIKYLLEHPNAYKDVAHYQQVNDLSAIVDNTVLSGVKILGIDNVTGSAGATTLIYMIKKLLEEKYGMKVAEIEIGKRDFDYFGLKDSITTTKDNLNTDISKSREADLILIDLNGHIDTTSCGDVLYLIEPSTIKLNKLMMTNGKVLRELQEKKVVLNKSLLDVNDIKEFESESDLKIFHNIPPVNDRIENQAIEELLIKLGIIKGTVEQPEKPSSGGLLGLFKH